MTAPRLTSEEHVTDLTWPAGPYRVVTSKAGGGNGLPNIYIAGPDDKKLAAVWGGADQRFATGYLLAAAPALFQALDGVCARILELRKAFGAPGDYGYETKEGKALAALYAAFNEASAPLNMAERGQ
jgi:hypothetical protein